jgi:DoxX-like family
MSKKTINIIYWISTGLFAAFMLLGSIPDVIQHPSAVEMVVKNLGYPAYFLPYLGVWKLLGVAAILYPGFPPLKEWAYAGFTFDMLSAMYSGYSVGDPPLSWLFIVLPIGVMAISYIFYHKKQVLGSRISE